MLALLLTSSGLATVPSSGVSLGIVLGDPSGLSVKFWGIGEKAALQLHLGGGGFISPADIAASGSILFHAALSRETPVNGYLGVGAYFGMDSRRGGENIGVMGVDMPIGLEFILREVPLDIFIEAPPIFYFTTNGDVGFGLSLGVGVRYILK